MATEKESNKATAEHMPCREGPVWTEERDVVAMKREIELEMEREREMLREKAKEVRARRREALMAKQRELEERERAIDQGLLMESKREEIAWMRSAIAKELEMEDVGNDNMPCRRHLRQGPVLMEDKVKAAALHEIKAALKEDSESCYICIARAAALHRIEAVGGDRAKAAADSESRSRSDIYVKKRVARAAEEEQEEGKADRPVGVVKETIKVRGTYIEWLLTGAPLTPLATLPEDYFEEEESADLREPMLALAFSVLSRIDKMDNILGQFLEKGYAMMEYQIDYGY